MKADGLTLRGSLAIVSQRRRTVIAAIVLSVVVAVVFLIVQTRIYAASTEVLVQPRGADGLFETQVLNVDDRAIQTEIQVIEGEQVRERVRADLELAELPPPVHASSIGQTDAISLTVRDPNPEVAARLADAYATAYVAVRRDQSVEELVAASAEVESAIEALQEQLDTVAESDPRRVSLIAQLANFTTTLDQLRVDSALRTGGAAVIKSATVPSDPVEPQPLRTIALAIVVGSLVGLVAAFALDRLDDKIRTDDDLEGAADLPVLAVVPVDPPTDHRPIAISDPDHPAVESIRGLRTNLQFLALDRQIRIVQLTSSMAGEGKTTIASNLAVVLAQAGNKVAIVDADLRRPRLHEVFGVPQSPGLTDLLLGVGSKLIVNNVQVDTDNRLSVFPAGAAPSNPSELLSGRRFASLMQRLGGLYDYVIVDSAPVLPVSDSVALSVSVDAVLVVAQAGRVSERSLRDAIDRLAQVGAPVLGTVLNQAAGRNSGYYGYRSNEPRTSAVSAAPITD